MNTCSSCGITSEVNTDFLEFAGNVSIPGEGGIIGNNIAFGPKQNWENDKSRTKIYGNRKFRLYSLLYCLDCTKRIMSDHYQNIIER